MIITIARECGSGGHAIAKMLSEDYGIELFDKTRLIKESKALNLYDENKNFVDETPINSMLYGLAMGYGSDHLQDRAFDLVRKITDGKDFVIVGHCSNYIFGNEDDVTTVFIHAREEIRIHNLMKKHDMNEKQAKNLMKMYDRRRADFQEHCTKQQWGIAKHYQLTVDAGLIGTKASADLIKQFIEYKKKNRG